MVISGIIAFVFSPVLLAHHLLLARIRASVRVRITRLVCAGSIASVNADIYSRFLLVGAKAKVVAVQS